MYTWDNLGKVNCGSPDFIVALCPGILCHSLRVCIPPPPKKSVTDTGSLPQTYKCKSTFILFLIVKFVYCWLKKVNKIQVKSHLYFAPFTHFSLLCAKGACTKVSSFLRCKIWSSYQNPHVALGTGSLHILMRPNMSHKRCIWSKSKLTSLKKLNAGSAPADWIHQSNKKWLNNWLQENTTKLIYLKISSHAVTANKF